MTSNRAWVFGVVGAAATVGLLAHVLHGSHPVAASAIDDGAQLLAGVAASISCWRNGSLAQGRERTWRWLMGAGFTSWSIGQLIWSYYQVFAGVGLPSPSLADVGYLGLPIFALIALLVLAKSGADRRTAVHKPLSRTVLVLDGCIVVASLFMITWETALGTVVRAGAPTDAEFAVAIAYPLSDLVLVTIVGLLLLWRRNVFATPGRLLTLGLGLVSLSVSDSFFAYLVSQGAEEMPPAYDIGFIAGPALIAIAAGLNQAWPGAHARRRNRAGELTYLLLPYFPLAASWVLIVTQLIQQGRIELIEIYFGLIICVMVVARQAFTLLENRTLLERVRDSQILLEYQAFHDPLTGLANRALFHERLVRAVDRHPRLGLLFIDLDDFKLVNDSLGHVAGDTVLREVGERLRSCVRERDTVARLGGDEFAILLDGAESPRAVGERLLAALRYPFFVSGRQVHVTASIGAIDTDGDLSADALMRRVDSAMYEGKQAGKGALVMYRGDFASGTDGRAHPDLPTRLAGALSEGRIGVHFQPIVRVNDGATVAVEALARWTDHVLGPVSPQVFVAAAESSGLIAELDDLVLDEACRIAAGLGPIRLHVNVSASRLGCPLLEGSVRDALRRHNLPGTRLILEITETSRIPDLTDALASVGRLRELGVQLALDDFGAGYNTLAQLHSLPADIVKLDQTLTRDADDALGQSVVAICRSMGMPVIAEGVETQAQVGRIMRWGCEFGQGYLYGRSAPADSLGLTPV
jgi:diguanylate cyclase (GGDEF)-like protein